MNNIILVILSASAGIAIGFVLCSLLRANGSDDESEDTKRLDFLEVNALHLGVAKSDERTFWGVVEPGSDRTPSRIGRSAREAIDYARAETRAP